ncbi:MAG TPA: ImmA/IrrE family metallo-endopeptidase [Terriglobales bacterium]|nr:ImmA/IrrE family metallo-endopeptidase [Terriglobales bacterium]
MATSEFCPNWISAPGDTIKDILRERSLSIAQLAARLEQSDSQVSDLLEGRSTITISLARKLNSALGGSVEFWMARDFQYREQSAKLQAQDREWLQDVPLGDMVSFGWVKQIPHPTEELSTALQFFGVRNTSDWHQMYGDVERVFAFRTSPSFDSRPVAVAAWLRQGEIEASKIDCADWSPDGFRQSLASIRKLTREKNPRSFLPRLQGICAEHGVAVAIVRAPTGCRASGATKLSLNRKALLLLSFRYLREDHFWFSFFHEAGHLLLHADKELFLEGFEKNSPEEKQANEFASEILVPHDRRDEMLNLRLSAEEIIRFSRRVGVSPGIVVGQLQHHRRIPQNYFHKLIRRYTWQ